MAPNRNIRSSPRVLVVGAGALGCAAARTLASSGAVDVALVDDDRVELSNLQRQVLFDDADLGSLKVDAAGRRLALDFDARVETHALRFDARSGPALVDDADLVIEATDDPPTKFLVGRLCAAAGRPWVHGGVSRTGGQWMLVVPGVSACLECVFPARGEETAAGCSALGVLAPVAGLVGSMQALTALAFLRAPSKPRAGRLHVYELTGARTRHIDFPPDEGCFCRRAGAGREGSGITDDILERRTAR